MENVAHAIQLATQDVVCVALEPIHTGDTVHVSIAQETEPIVLIAKENVALGHKLALVDLTHGDEIIKYGTSIGHATADIAAGTWVHTHNMATNLSGEVSYTYSPEQSLIESRAAQTFMGYRRLDGRAATRNELWIIPTVGCINNICDRIAQQTKAKLAGTEVEDVLVLRHPFGCSQTGDDFEQTKRILAQLAQHPNAAGVLIVSLGCEVLTHGSLLEALGDYDTERIKFLCCQDVEDEYKAADGLTDELITYANQFSREPISTRELVIGMKCGGSDGLSGITANPTIGRVSDILNAEGGSSLLTEVPEMFGAEDFLLNRCTSKEVFDDACSMLNNFKKYFISHHENVYDNPSPGNHDGGITTLEDKSCGCVQKGGHAPIVGVIDYGRGIQTTGLNLVCAPGNDLVSTTALTAAGAHVILFSTGRGTPFGALAPTLKIATNTPLYTKKHAWCDFNAGQIADGTKSLDECGEELFQLVLDTASGKKTSAEKGGFKEMAIWKDGVVE